MKANHVLAAVAVALCFTACSKNDGPETLIPAERKSVENLDVTNYGKWTYINLNTAYSFISRTAMTVSGIIS